MPGSSEGQLLPKGWESRSQGWPCAGCTLADGGTELQSCKDWTQGQNWGHQFWTSGHQRDKRWTRSRGPPRPQLGAKGEGIMDRWVKPNHRAEGVHPRDRNRAADQHFYSATGAGTDGPGAEVKWGPRSMCRGGWGSQVRLLMPLGLWQDVMNSPPLQDLSSDVGIVVTQPGCVTYCPFKHVEHDSLADTAF